MTKTFLPATLAALALSASSAHAQDFPVAREVAAVKADVSQLKAEVASLKAQLAGLTGVAAPAFPAACPCGDFCPCALAATPKATPAVVCTDAGCFPAGSAPAFAPTYAAGSACAGGSCAAPASYRFQPFGGRFRR
jgi:hypothetical protein